MKRMLMIAAFICSTMVGAFAQQMPPIPLDPNVKKGTLPNGLTYYLRHNEWPEKRADFYIAQKVGSMQEEDDQRGLAHFLEHMCFNGTTHFPGDNLKQYLERIGVKFGENLNAYTSVDETVYNINNVNVEIPGALDSCLLILHDWSHDLLLEGKEIDKERGVINEEWRMRSSAMMRMYEKAFPEIYQNSKYANRLPIGTMDVVMNFPYEAIRSYYKKWYRPDLQAVIIVGDFDVNEMEQKIQACFADIQPAAADAAVREYYEVYDNAEPIVSINKDKEQRNNMLSIMWKDDTFPEEMKGDLQYYIYTLAENALAQMFSARMQEILQKPNAPFMHASFGHGQFMLSKTKAAFDGTVVFKDNAHAEAVRALYREILRVKRHGFTVSEFERFKSEFLSELEDQYKSRDKVKSPQYVREYVRHFLDNEPAPGIEWEHQIMNMLMPQIPVELVNQTVAQIPDSNLVIAMFAPDKEDITYPTKEELLSILAEVEKEDIEAYAEEVSNDPLIAVMPTPGTVKSIKPSVYGTKLITLSNGVKVYVKETNFAPNEIKMTARSLGGTSLYSNDEYLNASNATMVSVGGWGNWSATNLQKRLAGIQASASPWIADDNEGLNGSCVKKDFETMLQLTYLCFTAPREDQEAFAATMERYRAALQNQDLDPRAALQDTIAKTVYDNDVRALRFRLADVDKLDYKRIMEIYKERFAAANDFEFFIIGDCNADSIAPLLAQYLGALPKGKAEKDKKISKHIAKGERVNVFEKQMETPSATVIFLYHTALKEDLRASLTMSIMEQTIDMLFTETVREDEGGAYSVGVNGGISGNIKDKENVKFQVYLPTAPDKLDRMTEVVYKGIEDYIANGPSEENFNKAKEYLIRKHAEDIKNNGYWQNEIVRFIRWKLNFVDNYEDTVNAITIDDIKALATKVFKSGNHIRVGMTAPKE